MASLEDLFQMHLGILTTAMRSAMSTRSHSHAQIISVWRLAQGSMIRMAEELNQMSPINNLPDELLILLFKSFLNIAARSGARDSLVTKPDVSSLLRLTHVCHRWRDLVICFPAFWTRVDNDNIDRFNEFTRRSRDLPLSLRLTIKEHISDASTIFRAYGQRIRRLTFSFSHMPCNISPLLDCAVPNDLECLIIAYNEESMRYSVPMTRQHLSPQICSSLSALALRPAALWFPADARFPSLTHLYLSADPRFAFGGIRDKPPLLPLLNKTPKLEFLHIVHPQGLNLDNVGAVNHSGTVVLPKLRSCVLVGGDLDSCFSVISKTSMPQNVWIRLDHIVHDPFLTDLRPLPPLPMKDQITHLEVALHSILHFHLRAEAPTGGVWLNTGVHDVHFNETASWTSWLCSLLETSTFPNLTSLHVDIVNSSTLSPLLQSFPQLTHLGVRLHTLWFGNPLRHGDASKYHEFFHLFGAPDGRAESLLLPALESLAFDITHNQIWMEHYGNDADLAGADVIASYSGPETSPEDVPSTASRAATHGSVLQDLHDPRADMDAIPQYALPPASLINALSARARAGKPVKRLAYQHWEELPGQHPRTQYSNGIAKFLRDATKGIVGECSVPGPDEFAVPLESREGWCPEDAEKYWPLGEKERPQYWLPRGSDL